MPGLGHLDFYTGFQALHQIGFSGFMSIECEVTNPEKSYLDSAYFLKSVIKKTCEESIL